MGGGEGGAAQACFTCHGLDGGGDGFGAPRLAGLDVGYLQKQMTDYAAGTRPDAVMKPIARWLDDGDRRAVAAWYAAMPAAPPASRAAPEAYLRALPERGLAACASCHGVAGEGVGPGNPSIAGQPAAYTVEQLRRWRTGERRNDPRGVMAEAAAALTEAEMHAIAAWLAPAPTARPLASGVASASAAATDAGGSAASRGARRPVR